MAVTSGMTEKTTETSCLMLRSVLSGFLTKMVRSDLLADALDYSAIIYSEILHY